MVTEQQIKLARDKFKEISGITIYTPDEGSLDDFEQSRYDGLVAALEAALSAQVQDVAELDEKTIVRLAWENFNENDYGRLTYERAPPMFPQAKYDVPTYALSQFVKAVRAAAPAKQEGT